MGVVILTLERSEGEGPTFISAKYQPFGSLVQPIATMVDIYWLEQNESDVPAANDWLSSSELLRFSKLRFAKRRSDWRLGRWTAKSAVATCLNLPDDRQSLAQIEIRAAPSGAPEVFLNDEPSKSTISLSHSAGRAICAVVPAEVALGCDLEAVESRSNVFVSDYFTAEEQALISHSKAGDRALLLALLWSAKESVLKALHQGLRLDTRCANAHPADINSADQAWHTLQVHTDAQVFDGWWQQSDNFIETVVVDPPAGAPMLLHTRPHSLVNPSR